MVQYYGQDDAELRFDEEFGLKLKEELYVQ